MKIKIVNPNTTLTMTEAIGRCARAVAAPGTLVEAVSPRMGPVSIECHYDEALAVPGLLEEIRRGEAEGVDAYVVACFGDPGMDAARELARGPVIGIAQAAMQMASLVGTGFSVVTTLERTCNMAWHLAERYGMTRFCRGVRGCEIPVLALEEPGSDARRVIVAACRAALVEDKSDCIVLGCAGMADLCAEIEAEIGVPVIDGVTSALKLAEALVALGLRSSVAGDWRQPGPKRMTGMLADFTLG